MFHMARSPSRRAAWEASKVSPWKDQGPLHYQSVKICYLQHSSLHLPLRSHQGSPHLIISSHNPQGPVSMILLSSIPPYYHAPTPD